MSPILQFVSVVAIGGLIGWITNKIAIKMLFRPIKPRRFLFFTIQGVFPKRKDQMSVSLAQTIEQELLSKEVIMDQILSSDKMDNFKAQVKDTLADKIVEMIPSALRMFMGNNPKEMIQGFVDKSGDQLILQVLNEFKESGMDNLDIEQIVKDRIDALDFEEFEKIIFGLMAKELKHIEIIGLFLGMIIGVIQFIIMNI